MARAVQQAERHSAEQVTRYILCGSKRMRANETSVFCVLRTKLVHARNRGIAIATPRNGNVVRERQVKAVKISLSAFRALQRSRQQQEQCAKQAV